MHNSGASRREIAKLWRQTMWPFEIEVGVCEALPTRETHSSCPDLPPPLKLRRSNTGLPRRSLLTAEVRLRTKAVGVAGIRASINLRNKVLEKEMDSRA